MMAKKLIFGACKEQILKLIVICTVPDGFTIYRTVDLFG